MSCFSFLLGKIVSPPEHIDVDDEYSSIQDAKVYSYKELKIGTNDFSYANKIGEGGFGSVYKGKLKNGTLIAVKVLSKESKQGKKEFLTELSTMVSMEHENLVKLEGYCVEEDHRILVYKYLENNSLAKTLLDRRHNNIQFDWKTRTKICVGIARGLTYLHEQVRPHIVHRDIKASNILLDKDLTPKVADFGLAKLFPANATHITTRVAGTIGYLAPEYAIRGKLTRKADIYSFGVLLLEIVSGRSNTNHSPPENQYLLERVWSLYEKVELVNIVDAFMGNFDEEEACKFLKIGLLCTQNIPRLRPSMSDVLKMLTGELEVIMEVTKPGILTDFNDLKIMGQTDKSRTKRNTQSTMSSRTWGNRSSTPSGNTSQTSTISDSSCRF